MTNLKLSELYPLAQIGGGGSSSIADTTFQGNKSADFTSVPNASYQITGSCKMTLHNSPTVGDKVVFWLTSTANFDITSTDKFNGSLLATDYVKRVTQLYVIIVLTYSGSTNGWGWDSRDNSYITNRYTGSGTLMPYTSTSSLNGIVNLLGTNYNSQAFANPNPSLITVSGAVTTVGHNVPTINNVTRLFDKVATSGSDLAGVTSATSNVGFELLFPAGHTLIPTVIAINYTDVGSGGMTLILEGIKADNSLETIGSLSVASGGSPSWRVFTYSGQTGFKGFYWHGVRLYYSTSNEFEAWGTCFFS